MIAATVCSGPHQAGGFTVGLSGVGGVYGVGTHVVTDHVIFIVVTMVITVVIMVVVVTIIFTHGTHHTHELAHG